MIVHFKCIWGYIRIQTLVDKDRLLLVLWTVIEGHRIISDLN